MARPQSVLCPEVLLYDRKSSYMKIHQQLQELASEIETIQKIATDSGMESREENISVMLREKAEELSTEMRAGATERQDSVWVTAAASSQFRCVYV